MLRRYKYSPHPDMVTWKTEYVPETFEGLKARKVDTLDTSTVTVNGVEFDADEKSMDRMARVIASANAKIAIDIAGGGDPSTVCQTRMAATISWKCADDVIRDIAISTLASALDLAIENMSDTWL